MIATWCLACDRFDVAGQFVGDDDPWLAELNNQPSQKALGGLHFASALNQNVERVAIGVRRPSELILHAIDQDNNLVHVPFVVWTWSIPVNTSGKMRTEPVDPKADRFAADDHAALRQKILDINRAEREAMLGPYSIGHQLTRKTKALQARHG